MPLAQTFAALQVPPFQLWNGVAQPYNAYLVTPPRLYSEDLYNYTGTFGALLISPTPVNLSPTTLTYAAELATINYPSYVLARWDFDPTTGAYVRKSYPGGQPLFTNIGLYMQEPFTDALWATGLYLDAYSHGAIGIDPVTLLSNGNVILQATYNTGAAVNTYVFGVDRSANVLVANWGATVNGQFNIFNFTTGALIASCFLPRVVTKTTGVMMTGKFIYITDSWRWLHIYDYTGKYYGSLLNDAVPPGITVQYAYDWRYKRIYTLPLTAPNADGSSTLQIVAYYPQPSLELVTKPIPRKVPRAGRTVTLFSHLSGGGLEPIAGRLGNGSGASAAGNFSDAQGDVVIPYTAAAAGAVSQTVSV